MAAPTPYFDPPSAEAAAIFTRDIADFLPEDEALDIKLGVDLETAALLHRIVVSRKENWSLSRFDGEIADLPDEARCWLRSKRVHILAGKVMADWELTAVLVRTIQRLMADDPECEGVKVGDVSDALAERDPFYGAQDSRNWMQRKFQSMNRGSEKSRGNKVARAVERIEGTTLYRPSEAALEEGVSKRERVSRDVMALFSRVFQHPLTNLRVNRFLKAKPQPRMRRNSERDFRDWAVFEGLLEPTPEQIEAADGDERLARHNAEMGARALYAQALESGTAGTIRPLHHAHYADLLEAQRRGAELDRADRDAYLIALGKGEEVDEPEPRAHENRLINRVMTQIDEFEARSYSADMVASYMMGDHQIMRIRRGRATSHMTYWLPERPDMPISPDSLLYSTALETALRRAGPGRPIWSTRQLGKGVNKVSRVILDLTWYDAARAAVKLHCDSVGRAIQSVIEDNQHRVMNDAPLYNPLEDSWIDVAFALADMPIGPGVSMTLGQAARKALEAACPIRDEINSSTPPGQVFRSALIERMQHLFDLNAEDNRTEIVAAMRRHDQQNVEHRHFSLELLGELSDIDADDDHPALNWDRARKIEAVAFIDSFLNGRYTALCAATRPYDRDFDPETDDWDADLESCFFKDFAEAMDVDFTALTHGKVRCDKLIRRPDTLVEWELKIEDNPDPVAPDSIALTFEDAEEPTTS